MVDDTTKVIIGAGIAFGLVFFLILVGVATGGMMASSGTINSTTVSGITDTAKSFLGNYGGIIGIVLLVAVVLGKLGIGDIIRSAFS